MGVERFGTAAFDQWDLAYDTLDRGETVADEVAPSLATSDPSLAAAVEGIELSFGGVKALSGVDISVRKGDIQAIIGPNGAGKSSVLNVIGGIYRPDRGLVSIGGESFAHVPTSRLAKLGVARTFQNLALLK